MYTGSEEPRKKNPRETANWLSFLTFSYTLPLLKKGFKGDLNESDIYAVPVSCNSKRCGDKISREWKNGTSTLKLLLRRFGRKYFTYTTIHLTWHLVSSTINPYATSHFISYFEKESKLQKSDALFYASILISMVLIRTMWLYNYFLLECTLTVQIKSSLTSLLYRKVLRLRPHDAQGTNMGKLMTILTKDIRTIETTLWGMSDMIIGLIKFVYLTYLLYTRVGIASFVVAAIMGVAIVVQIFLSKSILKLRLNVGKMADKRLHFTREILQNLKIIKMYAWEKFFHDRLCRARKQETRANLRCWYMGSVVTTFATLFAKLLFPVFLVSYMHFGFRTETELIYYLRELFGEYATVIGVNLPLGFGLSAEFYASIVRIGRILNLPEPPAVQLSNNHKPSIDLNKLTVTLDRNNILDDVTLHINKPGLYLITGPLGSGKTSLLRAILDEYVYKGQRMVAGTLSYSSQVPWLFPASIKQNIIFGQNFDRDRYQQVITLCCLNQDFGSMWQGDGTIVADSGHNLSKGQQARVNLARAIYRKSDIYVLDDPLACLDVRVQNQVFQKSILEFLSGKIVVMTTQNDKHLMWAKKVFVMTHGGLSTSNVVTDKWQLDEEMETCAYAEEPTEKIYEETHNVGSIDLSNYYKYIKYGGGVVAFSLLLLIFMGVQATNSYSSKLVATWVDLQQDLNQTTIFQRDTTFDLYMIMIITSSIMGLLKSYCFLEYCRRASIKFHKLMSRGIIQSVMSFIDGNFIGNILNRFSYDLDYLDEVFPFIFQDLIISALTIGGALVLVVTVHWIFLLILLVYIVGICLLRWFYVPTARTLKRLAATTRGPFIGHLNATIEGLSTIKAFKAQHLLQDQFDQLHDPFLSVNYMDFTTTLWFCYALDLNCLCLLSATISTLLIFDGEISVGNVGLAMGEVIIMSQSLMSILRVWVLLEQCMTSVERVVEYIEVPQENLQGGKSGIKQGKVEFRNVSLSYHKDLVLQDVNFTINPGEKVAIIGRTGSGKSSTISLLFRLYKFKGQILIDDQDSSQIPLGKLRGTISLIPQDPMTFSGIVRDNLDPMSHFLDRDIWRTIKTVHLDQIIGNLDQDIEELELTTGQKQLVTLARALLRNDQLVIMDEPTANLDNVSDVLVRDVIRDCFTKSTVIMVAHRLKWTVDFDRVMVMDKGRVKEFDCPANLLRDKASLYYRMLNKE